MPLRIAGCDAAGLVALVALRIVTRGPGPHLAVSTTTATELTAEQVQKILLEPLEQASVFLAAGPRIFDTNVVARIPSLGPRR